MRGCDWVAIRNLAITIGILTGFATTSAIFALNWHRWAPAGPWNNIITKVSFTFTATWAASAAVMVGIMMVFAGSFCSCSAKIPACAAACASLTIAMRALLGLLLALFGLCSVATVDDELWDNGVFVVGLIALAAACAGAMAGLGIVAAQIATCQP